MTDPCNLRVNGSRLWQRHMEIAAIGPVGNTGSCRLALSAEDAEARAVLARWAREAGLEILTDRAANMFMVRAGIEDVAPIAAGSHLDTQPRGGRFDGVSGVLAALEVAEAMNDAGIATRTPYAVINWTNEEGVRFAPGLLGSAWFTGKFDDAILSESETADGRTFADEAAARALAGPLAAGAFEMAAFFELHIEQGPILEASGSDVGIVTSVQGLRWLDVTLEGTEAHAGTTPLAARQDALLAAARVVARVNGIGREAGPDARVSVGRLKTATDGPSTIVGGAQLVIDIRHPDEATLERITDRCMDACEAEAAETGCAVTVRERICVSPTAFDDGCIGALEASAARLSLKHQRITSGALHDASNLAQIVPTAMLFVPCRDGISHNVAEYASPEHLAAGANVLLQTVLQRAGVAAPVSVP
ncbi:MAG: allantoate amidohydrolase [Devosia sp.]